MRPAPAFQIGLQHFGVWRAAVSTIVLTAGASLTAWTFAGSEPASPAALWACAFGVLGLAAVAASLWRVASLSLRWDGQCWNLGPLSTVGDEPWAGDVQVSIDLGAFMLLRWRPAAGAATPPLQWLPLQRRGHERQWHALRCAVFSPRPAPAAVTG